MRKEREESKGWGKKKESLGNKLRPWDWWLVLSFEAPAMAVVMVACVELWNSGHGGCGFDSKMERSGEERREREGERLKA